MGMGQYGSIPGIAQHWYFTIPTTLIRLPMDVWVFNYQCSNWTMLESSSILFNYHLFEDVRQFYSAFTHTKSICPNPQLPLSHPPAAPPLRPGRGSLGPSVFHQRRHRSQRHPGCWRRSISGSTWLRSKMTWSKMLNWPDTSAIHLTSLKHRARVFPDFPFPTWLGPVRDSCASIRDQRMIDQDQGSIHRSTNQTNCTIKGYCKWW